MAVKKYILVLNAGSSSLKFVVLELTSEIEIVKGLAERLGEPEAILQCHLNTKMRLELPARAGIHQALSCVGAYLNTLQLGSELMGIGHRVVHGGEHFQETTALTPAVLKQLKDISCLAPLHNPANIAGIEAALHNWPDLPHFAVFDTAFHQTMPEVAYRYALPEIYYTQKDIRRYGFHGASHSYVASRVRDLLGEKACRRVISAHLGNGCSLAAIKNGKSVDTSMGFTPLEGLVMGTRCGDLDPGVLLYLLQEQQMSPKDLNHLLNKESGLLGLSGLSNDFRSLIQAREAGHAGAALALDVFTYRAAKGIAALCMPLGGLDTLVFTGGIGENASWARQRILEHLAYLGLDCDPIKNENCKEGPISHSESPSAWVIPTREELMIARQCLIALEKDFIQ
jgi:acetate kinase